MIAYTFLVVLSVVVAYMEARDDARTIGKQAPINHRSEVFERMLMLGLLVVIVALAASVRNWTWAWEWRTLLFIPVSWAVFTIAFRYMLNKSRGKDWRYVAPWSNKYDLLWYALIMRRWPVEAPWLREVEAVYKIKEPVILDNVHRSGKFAYLFETLILCLSTAGYLIL